MKLTKLKKKFTGAFDAAEGAAYKAKLSIKRREGTLEAIELNGENIEKELDK